MTTFAQRPAPAPAGAQRILNERDPSAGQVFETGEVDVDASVVWERDGEQLVSATAVRWCELAVLVTWRDRRNPAGSVWLSPRDVRES